MTKGANSTAVKSFNENHSLYDKYRPSFPTILVDRFLVDLGLAQVVDGSIKLDTNKKVLELAAGTGKFTKNLVANGWNHNLTVVEPSEGMLKTFSTNFPHINAKLGSSYEIPVADSSVDAVVIAQGFHWFSDSKSLQEINRVLKPNGTLGCIWNFDCPSKSQQLKEFGNSAKISVFFDDIDLPEAETGEFDQVDPIRAQKLIQKAFELHPWNNKVSNFIYTFDVNVPQYRHGKWRDVFEADTEYFSSILHEHFLLHTSRVERKDIYRYWETRSYITALDETEKQKIKAKIESLVDQFVTEKDKVMLDGTTFIEKTMGTHSVVLQVKK